MLDLEGKISSLTNRRNSVDKNHILIKKIMKRREKENLQQRIKQLDLREHSLLQREQDLRRKEELWRRSDSDARYREEILKRQQEDELRQIEDARRAEEDERRMIEDARRMSEDHWWSQELEQRKFEDLRKVEEDEHRIQVQLQREEDKLLQERELEKRMLEDMFIEQKNYALLEKVDQIIEEGDYDLSNEFGLLETPIESDDEVELTNTTKSFKKNTTEDDEFVVVEKDIKSLDPTWKIMDNQNEDDEESAKEKEWVLLHGFPETETEYMNPITSFTKRLICAAADCESLVVLSKHQCQRCGSLYCNEHEHLIKDRNEETELCNVCEDYYYQPGVSWSITSEFLTERTLCYQTNLTLSETQIERMKPQLDSLSSKTRININPFQPLSTLSQSINPFKNRIWSNADTWSKCANCHVFFDKGSTKVPCKICLKEYCSKCGTLQKINFDPQLIGMNMNGGPLSIRACQNCVGVINASMRKEEYKEMLTNATHSNFFHVYRRSMKVRKRIEKNILELSDTITNDNTEFDDKQHIVLVNSLFRRLHQYISNFTTLLNELRNEDAENTSLYRVLTMVKKSMLNFLSENKRLHQKLLITKGVDIGAIM
eukprot:TRINITY_DN7536_c0_g1_i1.p1 TRINITY_DN7536_c0_g1~~TRINITY_DN7536_c0_g1_i1.p1  ORF type:complete len:602 (-),score=146.40 TRINITY_DN7536_c0_g1_i1:33-1838(-)